MYKYLFVLGRKWELSMVEIKSIFQDTKILEVNPSYLILGSEKEIDIKNEMRRLGGTIKICEVVGKFAEKNLISEMRDFLIQKYSDVNKVKYAISVLNFPVRNLNNYLLGVKKALRKEGKGGRFINKNLKNVAVPVLLNEGLLRGKGSEFILAKTENQYWVAETQAVQDIDKYSLRDYKKPFRDARMGMLPPKLAQILINLSGVKKGQTLWDPFCGSGTVLMEGLLQGVKVVGSDLKKENIEGTNQNLWWLCKEFDLPKDYQTFVQDVMEPFVEVPKVDVVVCEGYLGHPKSFLPQQDVLEKEINFLEILYEKFFSNLREVLEVGSVVVIALPCFKNRENYIYLKNILEKIKSLGYSPFALSETKRGSLIYDRKDQVVGREIFKFRIIPL